MDSDGVRFLRDHETSALTAGPVTMRHRRVGSTAEVRLSGELDMAGVPRVGEELARIEAWQPATILVDLSRLSFADSSGIRLLVLCHVRCKQRGGELRLVRPHRAVRHVLALTGLDSSFVIDD